MTYWQRWGAEDAGGEGAAAGLRYSRVVASLFTDRSQLRGEYFATASAAVCAAGERALDDVASTQGQTLRVDDLLSTLALEATIHHLDLVRHLDGVTAPGPKSLAATRQVIDRVAESVTGHRLPRAWAHERCVLLATGRAEPTTTEAHGLAFDRCMLPLFS